MPVSLAQASWEHEQQQAVVLRIEQPGLGAERFLSLAPSSRAVAIQS
jgi:hypothetical protein